VDRLGGAGVTVLGQHDHEGRGDHVVMADPEGNEFCVV
jgi:predicted enzyme related to lactoylglutathione lyase